MKSNMAKALFMTSDDVEMNLTFRSDSEARAAAMLLRASPSVKWASPFRSKEELLAAERNRKQLDAVRPLNR